jgi:hypothetical protein
MIVIIHSVNNHRTSIGGHKRAKKTCEVPVAAGTFNWAGPRIRFLGRTTTSPQRNLNTAPATFIFGGHLSKNAALCLMIRWIERTDQQSWPHDSGPWKILLDLDGFTCPQLQRHATGILCQAGIVKAAAEYLLFSSCAFPGATWVSVSAEVEGRGLRGWAAPALVR